jgi:hypothetical protein
MEFSHPCCANHDSRVRSGLRLAANVTVVVTIVGEVIWGFLHWDVARCAAAVFDVERAIDVLRMLSNRFGHRFIGLAAELVLISGGNPEITLIGPLVLSYERE